MSDAQFLIDDRYASRDELHDAHSRARIEGRYGPLVFIV